jgi:hypothetical protein
MCICAWFCENNFELDLCNDCDELWSDDHNYIKFLIKIDSLVKLGVIYFNYSLYLIIAPILFHD